MDLRSMKMLTALGVVIFGVSAVAGHAIAQSNMGDQEVIGVDATVDNSYTIAITDIDFDVIGASDWTTGTAATASVTPAGTTTETAGDGWAGTNPSFIVFEDPTAVTEGVVAITAAFANTNIYVSYDNCVNLTDGTQNFVVTRVWDNLNTPVLGTGVTMGDYDCVADTHTAIGVGETTAGGALTFNVGVEIAVPQAADTAYANAAYAGSVDMILHY